MSALVDLIKELSDLSRIGKDVAQIQTSISDLNNIYVALEARMAEIVRRLGVVEEKVFTVEARQIEERAANAKSRKPSRTRKRLRRRAS